jgi:tetratricopeptide (TPR) repeat protein
VNHRRFAAVLIASGCAVIAAVGPALARNPHCAGGIQYVVGGLRDKERGLAEDYQRQMQKALQQLTECAAGDPADLEALGYLAWAYAEVDSARLAGETFRKAIEGLTAKGDRKKTEWATNNRDSYWANAFNDGIAKINEAQGLYADFTRKPADESEVTLKEEAQKRYDAALASLQRAAFLRPGHPQTLRSLGSVHYFMGDFKTARAAFAEGLRQVPGDSLLGESLKNATTALGNQLIDEKKYDEAIATFGELTRAEPTNPDLFVGLASAYFSRAGGGTEAAAKAADYKAAADAYARAASMRPTAADLPFNAALAYQRAGDFTSAEAQWRATLALTPEDADALASLAEALAEQKKYNEAVQVLHRAVVKDPKNKNLHRQLGAVYSKAGNNAKSTEELLVFLALHQGKEAADPAAAARAAKAGSAAANAFAGLGAPDQVNDWTGDGQAYQTWFYWSKKLAYHFNADGAQAAKSDWSAAAAAK